MNKKIKYVIKSQISYGTTAKLYSVIAIHLGAIFLAYYRGFNPLNVICFLLFLQYITLSLLGNPIEKRDYVFNLITLTIKEIAFSRIIISFLGFVVIYSFGLALHLFVFDYTIEFRDSLHEFLGLGGLTINGVFFYLILCDTFEVIQSKSSFIWFNVIVGITISILVFGILITVEKLYSSSIESSIILISTIYIASIIFAYFSYLTYQKRESYLGYK